MSRKPDTFEKKKHGKEFEKMLLQMRAELMHGIQQRLQAKVERAGEKDIGDVYDAAADDQGKELDHLMSTRDREKLLEIDSALQRLKEGTYGVCEMSNEPISVKRLRVMPFARYTVEAQREMEEMNKLEKMREVEDDDRQFLELAQADFPNVPDEEEQPQE